MEEFPSCPQDGTGGFSPKLGLHLLSMGMCAALFVVHTVRFFRNWNNNNNNPAIDDEQVGVVATKQQDPSPKRCARCCASLGSPNQRKFHCDKCNFYVCRHCAQWDVERQVWTCKFCASPGSSPSPELLQKKLLDRCRVFESTRRSRSLRKVLDEYEHDNENDSGYHPSMSIGSEGSAFGEPPQDPVLMEVHENVEAIVEQLVGDSIDNTTLDPLCSHPEYERMVEIYHGRLRDALGQLIQSLRFAFNGQPLASDQTLTSTHCNLKYVISEVIEEAVGLPNLQGMDTHCGPMSPFGMSEDEDDLDNKTYEEILAIAILNKIIENHQQAKHNVRPKSESMTYVNGNHHESNNNKYSSECTSNLSNKEIQTDLETDVESSITKGSGGQVIHYSPTMDFSEDDYSFGTESASEDFSWAQGAGEHSPTVQYTVEEQIEEITTTVENSPDSKSRLTEAVNEPLIRQTVLRRDSVTPDLSYYCAGFEFAESHKVPFPELGMDLVDGDCVDEDVERDVAALVSAISSWQDNWLFRKKKSITPFRNMGDIVIGEEPVAMLVPNPQTEVRAKIGNRDIDELSDMSEKNSEGASEGFSSVDSDSPIEESISEEEEQETDQLDSKDSVQWTIPEPPTITVASFRSVNVPNQLEGKAEVNVAVTSEKHFLHDESSHLSDGPHSRKSSRVTTTLTVPIPAPRKSKSSTCSDEDRSTSECEPESTPVFVSPASRSKQCPDVRFAVLPESCSVPAGRTACVRCRVVATRPYGVAWFRGHEPVDQRLTRQFGDEHVLEIYDTQESDAGTYSCVAYGHSGETWADFRIDIVGSAASHVQPKFQQRLTDCSLEEGESLVLSCKVFGVPEPRVSWFKDGQQLVQNERFSFDQTGCGGWILKLDRVVSTDSGSYSVVAENRLAAVQSVAEVLVVPCDSLKVMTLTDRTNRAQDYIYHEAEKMMKSVNQQEAANAVRTTTGDALDLIAAISDSVQNQTVQSNNSRKNLQLDLSRPAIIPGSIADREHRKWQHAVELPNNPYSSENIAKRYQNNSSPLPRLARRSDQKSTSVVADGYDDHTLMVSDGPTKIDCGLKNIDPQKYGRDYYVNPVHQTTARLVKRPEGRLRSCATDVDLNNVEEKVYISTGRVFALEDKINSIESQVKDVDEDTSAAKVSILEDKVAHAVAQVAQNEKQVSMVEQEVARLQMEFLKRQQPRRSSSGSDVRGPNQVTMLGNSGSLERNLKSNWMADWKAGQSTGQSDEEAVATSYRMVSTDDGRVINLPSVRALANKFDGPAFQSGLFSNGSYEHKDDGTTIVRIDPKKPTAKPRGHSADWSAQPTSTNCLPEAPQRHSFCALSPLSNCSTVTTPEVHSLTARSLSREFREAAQRHLPKQPNRNIAVTASSQDRSGATIPPSTGTTVPATVQSIDTGVPASLDKPVPIGNGIRTTHHERHLASTDDSQDYTSDDSSGSLSSLPRVRPLKKLSRSIQDRAAFWDRRVREDRMADSSMSEEFPPMALQST